MKWSPIASTETRSPPNLKPQTTSQTSGTIRLNDPDVGAVRPRDRDLAMVFQSYTLYPHLTVEQNIEVPLTMRRLNSIERLPSLGRPLSGSG